MTELHTTATFDGHAPHTHVGSILGLWLAVVNALSDKVEINTYRDGYHWSQLYFDSKPSKLKRLEKSDKAGTSFKFIPNETMFSNLDYDQREIRRRLNELSCLNPGLVLRFEDNRTLQIEMCSGKGIADLLSNSGYGEKYSQVISGSGEYQGMAIGVAFSWQQFGNELKSFANQLCTMDGGTHVQGLISGIAAGLKEACKGKLSSNTFISTVKEDLNAVVNINIADPQFARPTRDRLINSEASKAVKEVTQRVFSDYLSNDQQLLKRLADRYISEQVHKCWVKSYREKKLVPNIQTVQLLIRDLFEVQNECSDLVDNYEELIRHLGELEPLDVSPLFMT